MANVPWVYDRCLAASGEHTWDGTGHCTFPGCDAINSQQLMEHAVANPLTHWVGMPEQPDGLTQDGKVIDLKTMDETEADYWRDVRPAMEQASREKRASNRDSSAKFLQHLGYAFESKNAGAHLIVQHRGLVIDFWPGTGLWIPRAKPTFKGRGVQRLIEYIRRNAP